MKLVTFQSFEALKSLINNGILVCDENFINLEKYGYAYNWIAEKMQNTFPNTTGSNYPIWAWVKFKNNIYPPKHRGVPVKGFDVKITFNKPNEDVFITDFRRYSFLLNNKYIPISKKDKEAFDKKLKDNNITEEELKAFVRKDKYSSHRQDNAYLTICKEIYQSFDRCITTDSDVLQGCVWNIRLDDVESIEILPKDNYTYGSFNYIRKSGNRFVSYMPRR